jgi:hypothetical protein
MTSPWATPAQEAEEPRDKRKLIQRWSVIVIVFLAMSGLLALTSATSSYEQYQRHVELDLDGTTLGYEAFIALVLVAMLMPLTATAWIFWVQALAGEISALFLIGVVRKNRAPDQIINYALLGVWYLGALGVAAVMSWAYLSGDNIEYFELSVISGLIWTSALASIGLVHRLSKQT